MLTAGWHAVVDKAGNTVPMLGYTVTYALLNVVLPNLRPLVVFIHLSAQATRRLAGGGRDTGAADLP